MWVDFKKGTRPSGNTSGKNTTETMQICYLDKRMNREKEIKLGERKKVERW